MNTAAAEAATDRWVVRAATDADTVPVLAMWLKNYRYSSWFTKPLADAVYYPRHEALIKAILARARIVVASLPDEPSVILGFAVREGDVVHYVYVKKAFRRWGIARSLVGDLPRDFRYSHRTFDAESILRRHPEAVYDPYAL